VRLKDPYRLPSTHPDLAGCMRFLVELEKLKLVYRQNSVIDGSRQENSAEHSWHLAMMALLLSGHADDKRIDPMRVLKMLLLHDIVEIDAGDTFVYNEAGNAAKAGKETASAKRIFGFLPPQPRREFLRLWKEFEGRKTPDALFAAALDGLQPLLNHYVSGGKWVKRHDLDKSKVLTKKRYIGKASKTLWEYSQALIELSAKAGIFRKRKTKKA
jgi:putative hydrolase of HD superfamily